MKDPRIAQYAQLLVDYSVQVKPGDKVLVRGNVQAAPLIEEVVRYVLRAGGIPRVVTSWSELARTIMTESSNEQLSTVTEFDKQLYTGFDCNIQISAPENSRAFTNLDQSKFGVQAKALQPFYKHLINEVRWTTCNYPTQSLAQDADMSLAEYADFLFDACLIDWKATEAYMAKVKAAFDAADMVRIVGPETDLTFSIRGRVGTICAGDKNMPDGEVFYAPIEDSMNGYITYDFPAIYQGREVDGIRLEFVNGRCVKATAKKGEEFLNRVLDTDEGARVVGEFGIGCNFGIQRFSKDILFDEKIGGTIHLAVGRAYEESGGTNMSAIHWDMIKDLRTQGRIELDGRVVQENGRFTGIEE